MIITVTCVHADLIHFGVGKDWFRRSRQKFLHMHSMLCSVLLLFINRTVYSIDVWLTYTAVLVDFYCKSSFASAEVWRVNYSSQDHKTLDFLLNIALSLDQ